MSQPLKSFSVEQVNIQPMPNKYLNNFDPKVFIACDDGAEIKKQENNLIPSTVGLPDPQKKTADNLIASFKAASKKFDYKTIEEYDRCGGSTRSLGTKEDNAYIVRLNSYFYFHDKTKKLKGEVYFIRTNKGASVVIFPNGDISLTHYVREADNTLVTQEKKIKGPGLSTDFSNGLEMIKVIKPNGEITSLTPVPPPKK